MLVRSLFLVALIGLSSVARADHDTSYHDGVKRPSAIGNHDLARRPYTSAPEAKSDVVEGNADITKVEEGEKKYKTLQLHSLGRRPYAEK
jgi:hypothetical protein